VFNFSRSLGLALCLPRPFFVRPSLQRIVGVINNCGSVGHCLLSGSRRRSVNYSQAHRSLSLNHLAP